jgi:hypothetical protein
MIHGTKMILVPQELAKALNGDLPTAPAPVGSYSAMDKEMSNILKSKNVDDFTKWKQYSNVLQRYMAKAERTKHSLTVNIEDDDDDDYDDDDGSTQQPPPPPTQPKIGKNVNPPASNIADGDDGAGEPTKKRTRKAIKAPASATPKNKTSSSGLPEILNSLANAKEKKEARDLFNALEESKQTIVTKTGILKIKRKNIGLLDPLIRYKIKGEPGKAPAGWEEFSGFISDLKGVPKYKAASVATRRGANKLVGNGGPWLTY